MHKLKKIRIGSRYIQAYWVKLLSKNLILLKGSRGFIMCGYLNLSAAQRAKDAAAKITGVCTLEEALKAKIHSATSAGRRLGLYPGQPVKEALKLLV